MKPKMIIEVTAAEYEQFLNDDTYLPQCVTLDADGLPNCEGRCPRNLICAMFVYKDAARRVAIEWFACATADDVAALADRAIPLQEAARTRRRIKYIAYCD